VAGIVARSPRTDARLALLGDKHFVVNPAGSAFVMYARHGRSLVAMGDPVAPDPADIAPLVWRFRELADRQDGTPVFYQITTEHLPVYLDAGFSLVKLGEEAWVDLDAFTLEGSTGRKLRQSRAAAERRGLSFAIVPSEEVGAILNELRDVSDAWLGDKGREKGFSLGYWSDPYIRAHDIAVVRHEERMVAFANIWRGGGNGAEISVDLMRHRPEAPPGTMDLMFIALMDAAKTQGYRWFNLGMAPLSGLPAHRLMPVWARLANFAYRRGDRFYNFEGLRSFKQKFNPVWRPKYLAYVGSFSLPQILFDVTRLIAQGPRPLA
jgi:phosphatidylglycerol lysyltransferase